VPYILIPCNGSFANILWWCWSRGGGEGLSIRTTWRAAAFLLRSVTSLHPMHCELISLPRNNGAFCCEVYANAASETPRRTRMRNRWLKAVTLVNNPSLVLERLVQLKRQTESTGDDDARCSLKVFESGALFTIQSVGGISHQPCCLPHQPFGNCQCPTSAFTDEQHVRSHAQRDYPCR